MIVKHTSTSNVQLLLRREATEVHLHVADMRTAILPAAIVLSPDQAREAAKTLTDLAESIEFGIEFGEGGFVPHVALQHQDAIGRYFHDVSDVIDNVLRPNADKGAMMVGTYAHSVIYGWNSGRSAVDCAADISGYFASQGGRS